MSPQPPTLLPGIYRAVRGPVVVAVMDGVGLGPHDAGNAVAQAHTPHLDRLMSGSLSGQLQAHGDAVGLALGDVGNSEVGHNALGAGQIFDQGAKRVAEAVSSGEAFRTETWQALVSHCKSHQSTLHLIGLLSDGNVHSHIDHTIALVAQADAAGIETLRVHVLWDGRDVPRTSAPIYLTRLETALAACMAKPRRSYRVASGGGRMQVTMDRYGADWPMVARGWATHVRGEARPFHSAQAALSTLREENPDLGDQDLPAFVVVDPQGPIGPIRDGDGVLATNFRGDRMLELCQAFEDETFTRFDRGPAPRVFFAGMTVYDAEARRPARFLVPPPQITGTLAEALSARGIAQLAVSETQKFGHVTYFWNGNRGEPFNRSLEHSIEIPSHPAPFDAHPEMRAQEIVAATRAALRARPFGLARVNFANGDMVGHTGNLAATILAIEAVDRALGELSEAVKSVQGALVLTADHGNAEEMLEREPASGQLRRDATGAYVPKNSHTTHPVPWAIELSPRDEGRFILSAAAKQKPGLSQIAATCLTLMGLESPKGAYRPSLIDVA